MRALEISVSSNISNRFTSSNTVKTANSAKASCSTKLSASLKAFLTIGLVSSGVAAISTRAEMSPSFPDLSEEASSQKSFFQNRFFSFFTNIFHSVFNGTQDLFFDIENRQVRRGLAIVELGTFAVLTAELSKRLSILEAFCGSTVLEYVILNKMKGNKFFHWDNLTFCIIGCFNFSVITATKLYYAFRLGKLTPTQPEIIFSQPPEQLPNQSPSTQNLATCFYPGQQIPLFSNTQTTPPQSPQDQVTIFPTSTSFILTPAPQQLRRVQDPSTLNRRKTETSLSLKQPKPSNIPPADKEKRRKSSVSTSSQNLLPTKQNESNMPKTHIEKSKSSDSDIVIQEE